MEIEGIEFQTQDYYEDEFMVVKQENLPKSSWKKKEKKSVESYKQLIVPETMKSPFWEYFGFPADNEGNIISKETCICSICGQQLSYCQNTTNLRSHLRNKHKSELKMLAEKQELKLSKELSDKKEKTHTEVFTITKKKEPEVEKRFHYELEDIEESYEPETSNQSMGIHSFHLVEDNLEELEEPPFKTIKLDPLNTGQKTPKKTMTMNVSYIKPSSPPQMMTTQDDVTTNILKMILQDLLPLDFVEGPGFRSFVNSFVPSYTVPESSNFADTITKFYDRYASNFFTLVKQTIKDYFSICFERWENEDNKAFLTVSVNVLEIASFELQNIVIDVIEHSTNYNWNMFFRKHEYLNMKDKCFGCVLNFSDPILANFMNARNIPVIPCLVSCLERAIESTLNLNCVSSIMDTICNTFDSRKDLTYPESSWLNKWEKLLEFKEQLDQGTLSVDSDLENNANYIVNFVQPIKICMELLGDLIPSASLIKPLLEQLLEKHLSTDCENDVVAAMKQNIHGIFAIDERSLKFLNAASFLDPRFNQALDSDSLSEVKGSIKEEAQRKFDDFHKPGPIKNEADKIVENDNKLKRLSFIFNKDSPKVGVSLEQNRNNMLYKFDAEFEKYAQEESISIESCPGKWWTEFGYVYTSLKKIADHYFCVTHSSHSRFKLPLREQFNFTSRRRRLNDGFTEKIMFLHCNRDVFEHLT